MKSNKNNWYHRRR